MKIATSKISPQGQISVPQEVRRRLGLVPGSTIEWDAEGNEVRIRRAGNQGFESLRRRIFPDGPPPVKTVEEMDEAIRAHMRAKYARR